MRRFDSKLLSVSSSVFLRFALGISFLSAVGNRFGLWGAFGAPHLAWGTFARFVAYTGQLNWFVPKATIPTPGYFGDLRRNSSGCSAAARMADADRSTLKRSSALAIALTMPGLLGSRYLGRLRWSVSSGQLRGIPIQH